MLLKFGTFRIEYTSVLSLVSAYWPRQSGRALGATTWMVTRSTFWSWLAGTGPEDQSHGVVMPFMYTVKRGGTVPPGFLIRAIRSIDPPLFPGVGVAPEESP
ncbi:MAG: hypothetical protein DMD43_10605 [Gemmatimonadetes bacterium]|nr:MAG: hypothetical protein DMD43_10605 [Gemmatimonadota bacterium]